MVRATRSIAWTPRLPIPTAIVPPGCDSLAQAAAAYQPPDRSRHVIEVAAAGSIAGLEPRVEKPWNIMTFAASLVRWSDKIVPHADAQSHDCTKLHQP